MKRTTDDLGKKYINYDFFDILNWEFPYSLEVEKVIITTHRENREKHSTYTSEKIWSSSGRGQMLLRNML